MPARSWPASSRRGRSWGWKDPRTVPLLPLWLPLLPEAGFAIVYRAPWEVIESLYRRGDAAFTDDPELAVQVWLHYNRVLLDLALAAPERCVVANVEAMATHPAAWVAAVAARTSTPLGTPGAAVVEPSLLHGDQARERAGLLFRHYPEVVALYEQLQHLAWRPAAWTRPPRGRTTRSRRRIGGWPCTTGRGPRGRRVNGAARRPRRTTPTPSWTTARPRAGVRAAGARRGSSRPARGCATSSCASGASRFPVSAP